MYMGKRFTRSNRRHNRRGITRRRRKYSRHMRGGRVRRGAQKSKEEDWISALGITISSDETLYNQVYDNAESLNINSLPVFIQLFDYLPIQRSDSLLDVGSGLGLMCLLIKQRLPFGKVYGVERNMKLYDASKRNLSLIGMKGVKFLNKDIFDMSIPNDVTYFYLFNPFHYGIQKFNKLCSKIKAFCKRKKRKVTIIWINSSSEAKPLEHDRVLERLNATIIKKGVLVYSYLIFTMDPSNSR
jgi:SAM-dependent methyltransferase